MVLTSVPSYVYITFFKTVFLVIFLGAAHGLIVLPVLLSLLDLQALIGSKSAKAASVAKEVAKTVKEVPMALEVQSPKKIFYCSEKLAYPL